MATLRAARLAASNEGPPKLRVAIAAEAMPTAVAGMLSFFRPTPWNGWLLMSCCSIWNRPEVRHRLGA